MEFLTADTLTSKICPKKCNYPFPVKYTTGRVLENDKVVICGGEIKDNIRKIARGEDALNICFSLNNTVQWDLQAVMKKYRYGGASAVIKDGSELWVTGGVPMEHETEVVK